MRLSPKQKPYLRKVYIHTFIYATYINSFTLVELRGVEPLSKMCPSSKHLQFSLLLSKTESMLQTGNPEFAFSVFGW